MTHELRMTVHVALEAVEDGHAFFVRTQAGHLASAPVRINVDPYPASALVAAGLRVQVGPLDV